MNWQQAIEHLSEKVARKYKIPNSDALRAAVKAGIEYECDAWCQQTR